MILLNPNVGALARLVSDDDRRYYAISGVRVVERADGYLVEATDGKYLGRVVGSHHQGAPEEYPVVAALQAAPNGATSAILPPNALTAACKSAPKKNSKPILQSVAVVLGEFESTLCTADQEGALVRQQHNMEGRWVDSDGVFPTSDPDSTVSIDAAKLAELLTVARQFADTNGAVTLELRGPNTPVVIRAQNTDQEFTGLLMPLT